MLPPGLGCPRMVAVESFKTFQAVTCTPGVLPAWPTFAAPLSASVIARTASATKRAFLPTPRDRTLIPLSLLRRASTQLAAPQDPDRELLASASQGCVAWAGAVRR